MLAQSLDGGHIIRLTGDVEAGQAITRLLVDINVIVVQEPGEDLSVIVADGGGEGGGVVGHTVDVHSGEADQVREDLHIALRARLKKSLIDVHCH